MEKEIIIGIDIGGTNIKTGLVENKVITSTCSNPTLPNRTADEILDTLYTTIDAVLKQETKAIGIGVPGLLDADQGQILNISNIPSWKDLPLKSKLEQRYQIPVYINNDANCFALGEKHFGSGQKYKNMIAIALGTGVGGGIIVNNKIHTGFAGGAGEVGHWPYKNEIFENFCGSKFFKKHNTTGEKLFQQATEGNSEALALFNEFGIHLGKLLQNVLYILAPESIILGGSISKSFEFFKNGIETELSNFPFEIIRNGVTIEQSVLSQSAILGAAGLYYDHNMR